MSSFTDVIRAELAEAQDVLTAFLANPENVVNIAAAAEMLGAAINKGGKIMSCGNGGSLCDAMHFAEELTGRYRENRPPIAAISLSDASHLSCVSNDYGYDVVFSRFVEALGQPQDVLLGISTSGNSANVVKAAEAARAKGLKVVTLTGKDGGKLRPLSDVEINVPHYGYADRIQEIHIKVIHILILLIEKQLQQDVP
jgi:D-sedoheptulose 7-phosphate isomerase